ncbi:MAG: putative porin [Woeseiaceae bacterium]|nr:putative porin [Woeseiaceae bacterium]
MKFFVAACAALLSILVLHEPALADNHQSNWADRIVFKGDTRLRHERIDEDGEEDRARMRFRLRFGFATTIVEDVDFVVRLASGGDNPVSTNQSFDDGFSTKDIGIDQAYIKWAAADGLDLFAGKMPTPMFKAGKVPLIWDSDLNVEGFALKYASGMFFGSLGGYSVEERGSADDSLLYSAQGGLKFDVADGAKLTVGAGYFAYTNTIGNEPFYNGRSKGNTVDVDGNLVYDYENTEAFAQFDTKLGDWPFQVYAHYTVNNEVDAEDTAYAFGAKIGSAKKQGTQQFSWTYQDIEADAVIATFNDSDFGGGGTDSDGHMLKYKYMLRDQISLGGTLMINSVDRFQGTEHDYNRLQLDVEFKFK